MKTVRVSASQVKLALLCWRKWAFAYVLGLKEPETRALALGTAVHTILEDYLRDGTVPDPAATWTFSAYLIKTIKYGSDNDAAKAQAVWDAGGKDDTKAFYPGKIALSMMPAGVLAAPGIGTVEGKFEWLWDGVLWNGLIDHHVFNPTAPPGDEFDSLPGHEKRGLIVLTDHKTSSNPAQWGLTDEQLHTDVQAVLYARVLLAELGPANVRAQWNYGATDASPTKSKVATARYTPGEAYALFEQHVQPVGKEIRRLRLMKVDPLSLPPSPDNCYAYHKPCPHIDKCNLTTNERIGSLIMSTEANGQSMIDALLSEANAGATPAAPMPPVVDGAGVNPPEANTTAPANPVPPDAAARLRAVGTAPATAPVVPLTTAPVVPVVPVVPLTTAPTPPTTTLPAAATPKPPRKPRAPKVAPAVEAAAPTGSIDAALKQLSTIREHDPRLADAVADKLADRIATILLGGAS